MTGWPVLALDTVKEPFLAELGAVDRLGPQTGAQRVVMGEQPVQPLVQGFLVAQVRDPDGAAADLVLVGRADAAAGGADLALAQEALLHAVERLVVGRY